MREALIGTSRRRNFLRTNTTSFCHLTIRYLHAKRCECRFRQHYSYHPEPVEAKECHSATDCESGINYSLLMRRHFFALLFLYLFGRGTRSNRVPRENTRCRRKYSTRIRSTLDLTLTDVLNQA